MKELVSSNDVVFLSFAQDLLKQEGIEFVLLDKNMSLLEGSIGILPRRLMVSEERYEEAQALMRSSLAKVEDVSGGKIRTHSSDQREFSEDVTDDEFLGGALKIYQSKSGFRSGIDAILLAACVPREGKLHVLEAGAGTGVVSLAVAKRNSQAMVEGIEIEDFNSELAVENASRNDLSSRVQMHLGDLCDPVTKLEILGLQRNSFDYVLANPPFYTEGETRTSSNPLRLRARRALEGGLEEWIRFMTAMAAPKGKFLMIHRAERLGDLFKHLQGRFGALRVLPIYPKENSAANRVLVQGVKGSRAPMVILPGLVLHREDGTYVPEVKSICERIEDVTGPLAGLFD